MQFDASAEDVGKRLDRFLAEKMPETSRSRIQDWIREDRVLVNGAKARPSRSIEAGDAIEVDPAPAKPLHAFPENIPLDILYEDDDVAAINKAAGMTVHAGAGVAEGTLVNALLHHFASLSRLGGELRPGIVHRLDRFTSGVLLVAKNDRAHQHLARQFESRKVQKIYWAVVEGRVSEMDLTAGRLASRGIYPQRIEADGHWWLRLEMPIRRDPSHRVRMTSKAPRTFVRHPADRFEPEDEETPAGRPARTDFRVLQSFPRHALLEVRIATGRTHQIRVHLSAIGHPVVGDRLYGARGAGTRGAGLRPARQSNQATQGLDPQPFGPQDPANPSRGPEPCGTEIAGGRFLLHARQIRFLQPTSREVLLLEAPLPPDFTDFMQTLGGIMEDKGRG